MHNTSSNPEPDWTMKQTKTSRSGPLGMVHPMSGAKFRITARAMPGRLATLFALLTLLLLAGCDDGQGAEQEAQASTAASESSNGPASESSNGPPSTISSRSATIPEAQDNASSLPRARGVNVEVMTLQPKDFTLTATYIGHLEPNQRVSLKSELEGLVEKVNFTEGQAVKANQVLVNISTKEQSVRRDQAGATLQLAKQNLTRDLELFDKNLIPQSKLDISTNTRDQARFSLQLAELGLRKSVVRTPLSGQVKIRNVDTGEFVNKGTLLAEILDISTVKAEVNVPEQDIRHMQTGRQVSVQVDALPDEVFTGRVQKLGVEADQASRSFPVEIAIANPKRALLPGMLARVKMRMGTYRNQILIPRHALLERSTGRVVYVARGNTAVEVSIETGANADGLMQVLQGLHAGDKLIVTGQQQLTTNDPITVTRELP